jgi:hypothetical protein
MANLAIELLIDKRVKILQEQYEMNIKFNEELAQLNKAINQLGGTNYKADDEVFNYDDTNPTYITGTEDGI